MSIAKCPICHSKNETPYWQIGLCILCPTCNSEFLFKDGSIYELGLCGESGIECTFSDFMQVLGTYMDHSAAKKVIGEPLNLDVVGGECGILFTASNGEVLTYEMVHELVQLNSVSRGAFYQYAMSKWR